jgi:hypothetical protein
MRYGHDGAFRRIGPKRRPSTRDGLTRSQAEVEMRKLIGPIGMTIAKAGELLVEPASTRGLMRSTVMSYESKLVGGPV